MKFYLLEEVVANGHQGRVVGFDRINGRLFVEIGAHNILGEYSTFFADAEHVQPFTKKLVVRHV